MPRTAGRTRARRAGAILAVAVAVGAVLMPVVSATTAPTATAAPGIPENPSVAWSEDFENGQGNTPTGLGSYTSATGSTYTGTTFWLDYANCNGVILNYLASRAGNGDVVTFPTPFCTTPTVATAQNNARRMADVLGQVAAGVVGGATATTPVNGSTAATQANHALAEWTTLGAAGTPNQLVVGNTAPLGLTATTSRYYTPSIDVVEASCAYLGGANNSRRTRSGDQRGRDPRHSHRGPRVHRPARHLLLVPRCRRAPAPTRGERRRLGARGSIPGHLVDPAHPRAARDRLGARAQREHGDRRQRLRHRQHPGARRDPESGQGLRPLQRSPAAARRPSRSRSPTPRISPRRSTWASSTPRRTRRGEHPGDRRHLHEHDGRRSRAHRARGGQHDHGVGRRLRRRGQPRSP